MELLALLIPVVGLLLGLGLSWKFTFAWFVPWLEIKDPQTAKWVGFFAWLLVFGGIGAVVGFFAGGAIAAGLMMH